MYNSSISHAFNNFIDIKISLSIQVRLSPLLQIQDIFTFILLHFWDKFRKHRQTIGLWIQLQEVSCWTTISSISVSKTGIYTYSDLYAHMFLWESRKLCTIAERVDCRAIKEKQRVTWSAQSSQWNRSYRDMWIVMFSVMLLLRNVCQCRK